MRILATIGGAGVAIVVLGLISLTAVGLVGW